MTRPPSTKTEFARRACSVVKDEKPDLYNGVALRVITLDEAKSHGWVAFFDGKTECPTGHIAARYVSNPSLCIDCRRIADGKLPIYTRGDANDDLTGAQVYVEPVADAKFDWTDEKWRQFTVACINTGDKLAALKVIGAQPYHLLTLLESSAKHHAEFEATQAKMDQVALWMAEGKAAAGSERMMLAQAGAKFPDSFGSRNRSGVDLPSQPLSPEKSLARLRQLISGLVGSSDVQPGIQGGATDSARQVAVDVARSPERNHPRAAGESVLEDPHDNSDLV